MINCLKCQAELTEADLNAGDCPFCGAVLDADQLADSRQMPDDMPTSPGSGAEAEQLSTDADQTSDRQGERPPGSGTIDERAASGTVDATSLPSEIIEQLGASDEPGGGQAQDSTPPPPGHQTVDMASGSSTVDATSLPDSIDLTDSSSNSSETVDSVEVPQDNSQATIAQWAGSATVDSVQSTDEPSAGGERTVDSIGDPSLVEGDGTGTVSERNIRKTVDVGGEEIAKTHDSTIPERHGQATIDVSGAAGDSADEQPPTVKSRGEMRTLDSSELTAGEAKRMQDMWGGAAKELASPRMTIRGFEPQIVGSGTSSLVIQRRGFRDAEESQTPGADYDLIRKLGQGGMGVVYAARQASIDRDVAVKMLLPKTAKDANQRNKFLAEAVITGDLDHPNIVPIYDLGKNDQGGLFYAMKQVQGTPWDECIAEKSLSENVELLMKTCDAIAFAHSRGFIHRDLKPENTMLGDFGEALVMDWGLAIPYGAHQKSRAVMPKPGMGGTPAYMAPEMATGPFDKLGPASDVYLLGAILFEILTGSPPHRGKNVMKCLLAAAKNEIVATDQGGELMDIAMKAMSTQPEDRYGSVREFQEAIREYQDHSESVAMAVRAQDELDAAELEDDYQRYNKSLFGFQEALALWSGNERAREGVSNSKLAYASSALEKGDLDLAASLIDPDDAAHTVLADKIVSARREREARQQRLRQFKRGVVGLAATVFLVIAVGLILVNSARNEALHQKSLAEVNAAEAQRQEGVANENAAEARRQESIAKDNAARAIEQERVARRNESKALAAETEARRQQQIAEQNEAEAVQQRDRAEYEAYVALIGLAAAKIAENAFVDARQLLTSDVCKPALRSWEWGRLMHLCNQSIRQYDPGAPVEVVAFGPRGKRFATGGWSGTAAVWDTDSGELVTRIEHDGLYVYGVAFSPDGKYLATGGNDPRAYVRIWDAETGAPVSPPLLGHTDAVTSVEFSPSGRWLATTSFDHTARVWNVEQVSQPIEAPGSPLEGHNWWVWDAAFSPDENESYLVTAGQDGKAIVWDRKSGAARPAFTGHQGPVYSATFSPQGDYVVTGGYDKRVLLWRPDELQDFDYDRLLSGQTPPPPNYRELAGHAGAVRSVATVQSGEKTLILSAGHDNTLKLWDAPSLALLQTMRGHGSWVRGCGFSPDGKWVVSGGYDKQDPVKLWNIQGYEEVRVLRGLVFDGHVDAIMSAAFSPDNSRIVTASRDRTAKTWFVDSGLEERSFDEGHAYLASDAVFFPAGRRLATSAVDNTVRIWDVASGVELRQLDRTGRAAALAISPDGEWLLTGSSEPRVEDSDPLRRTPRDSRKVKLWEAETGKLAAELRGGHHAEVSAVAFAPAGPLVVSGDMNGRLVYWDRESRQEIQRVSWHSSKVSGIRFSPDGQWLLTASDDKTVAQWQLVDGRATGPDETRILKHPDSVLSLSLSSGGELALTACADGKVRLWDRQQVRVLRELSFPADNVSSAALSPAGRIALTVHPEEQLVRLWDLDSGAEILQLSAGRPVWTSVFSRDGNALLTVGGDEARLLDLRAEDPSRRLLMAFSPHASVAAANFSSDRQRVVTASWDNSAKIWNAQTGLALRRLAGVHDGYVNSAMFSHDDRLVLTAGDDGLAVIWNSDSGEVVRTFSAHSARIRSARFSPDGTRIVTASDDRTARIWEVDDASAALQVLGGDADGHQWAVHCAVFSNDGQWVLTGSEDNTAKLWNAESGELLETLAGHTAAVTSVAISPDGSRALTASADFTAKLWDTRTGKEILNLKGHTQEVTSVAFSSDGRYVLTGSRDGTAIVWLSVEW